jgi:hypothetical protein
LWTNAISDAVQVCFQVVNLHPEAINDFSNNRDIVPSRTPQQTPYRPWAAVLPIFACGGAKPSNEASHLSLDSTASTSGTAPSEGPWLAFELLPLHFQPGPENSIQHFLGHQKVSMPALAAVLEHSQLSGFAWPVPLTTEPKYMAEFLCRTPPALSPGDELEGAVPQILIGMFPKPGHGCGPDFSDQTLTLHCEPSCTGQ